MRMKLQSFISLSLSTLLALSASPAIAEECPNDLCEVVFESTGSGVHFELPANARNLAFEVSGAAGGRGGNGGRVTGRFLEVPSSVWIYVGGEGAVGAGVAGGFNGGGNAGGNRGNEGSGGGASDIRTGTSLSDRILVAGGGGGAGGFSGAAGGIGGNTAAAAGGSGQGAGGGGGSETMGGQRGSSNGGSAATSGSFGSGGTGGTSWNAGGGGGGGGWYGGGGGGSDDDTCCSDGGGGGGGSSYAATNLFADIVHEAGVHSGAGQVIIRYELVSEITSLVATQQSSLLVEVALTSTGSFVPSTSDIVFADQNCQAAEPVLVEGIFVFAVSGCQAEAFSMSLVNEAAGLMKAGVSGVATLELDLTGPEAALAMTAPDGASYLIEVSATEEFSGLELSDFAVAGCEFTELSGSKLTLGECDEGQLTATLLAGTIQDSMGNLGPETDLVLSFLRDTIPPSAIWGDPVVELIDAGYNVSLELIFDGELVEGAGVEFAADPIGCLPVTTFTESGILFQHTHCAPSLISWVLPPLSLVDSAGNLGPATELSFARTLDAIPEPEPEPAPEPEPEPVAQPDLVQNPIPEPEVQEPVQSPVLPESNVSEPTEEQAVTEDPEPQLEEELERILEEEIIQEAPSGSAEELVIEVAPWPAPLVRAEEDPSPVIEIEPPVVEPEVQILDGLEPVGSELPVATAAPIAQLASLETDAVSQQSFVGSIAPWLTGGVVIGALVFLGYRKMMVR